MLHAAEWPSLSSSAFALFTPSPSPCLVHSLGFRSIPLLPFPTDRTRIRIICTICAGCASNLFTCLSSIRSVCVCLYMGYAGVQALALHMSCFQDISSVAPRDSSSAVLPRQSSAVSDVFNRNIFGVRATFCVELLPTRARLIDVMWCAVCARAQKSSMLPMKSSSSS
jgi:hypothetical protein